MLQSAKLSAGHGRALLAAADPERLAGTIVEKNLSVRETERLAQLPQSQPGSRPRRRSAKPADIAALEKDLTAALGLVVDLRHDDNGRGEIRIAYRTLEQLEAVCAKLRR
jgi:ParB family chromosome partitioning protein